MAEILIDHGADLNLIDSDDSSPLHIATSEGNSKRISQILKQKIETLSFLCLGHGEIVKILIDHGANVNIKSSTGSTPLHEAGMLGIIK